MPTHAELELLGVRQKNNLSHILNRFAEHLMNAVIIPNFRFITLVAGLLGALVSITAAQTVTLVVNNESNQALTFTPQLTVLSPAGDGTATLTAGTTPITVGPNDTNNQVSVSFNANPGPVTVTLEVDGSFAETAFAFIQVFGTSAQGVVSYNLGTVRPFDTPSVLTPSGQANYTITLTIPSNPVILPTTTWRVNQLVVQKDGTNFFAKGVAYAPTPIGGATFQPGIGDWFVPPWWTYNGDNSPNDIGRRDTAILTAIGHQCNANLLHLVLVEAAGPLLPAEYHAGFSHDRVHEYAIPLHGLF